MPPAGVQDGLAAQRRFAIDIPALIGLTVRLHLEALNIADGGAPKPLHQRLAGLRALRQRLRQDDERIIRRLVSGIEERPDLLVVAGVPHDQALYSDQNVSIAWYFTSSENACCALDAATTLAPSVSFI